jgi:hypothetical protein
VRQIGRANVPLLAIAMSALLLACNSPSAPSAASAAGSYTLATVNGAKLPVTVTIAGATTTIESGSIALSADGAVVSHHTTRPSGATQSGTTSSTGTWAIVGSAIRLDMQGADLAGSLSATFASGALTVTVAQGRVERFTK